MSFSLRDFCEPGDEYVDFVTGKREAVGMPINSKSNPILAEMRRTWNEDRAYHENDIALCADRVLLSDVEEPSAADHYPQKVRDDAERVLCRIISVAELDSAPNLR